MARTHVTLSFYLPTTSLARLGDMVAAVKIALEDHRAENMFINYSGPHPDNTESNENEAERMGRRSTGGGKAGEGSEGKRSTADSDDGTGADDGAEPVKRKRGRPAKGSGKAEEVGRSNDDTSTGRAEGSRRNEPVRTREGADEGADSREEGQRGAGRSRDDQRGNRQAARISTGEDRGEADDDDDSDIPEFLKKGDDRKKSPAKSKPKTDDEDDGWGDDDNSVGDAADASDDWTEEENPRLVAARNKAEWPDDLLPVKPRDIDKTVCTTLLGEHFKATGGKDRQITFDVMEIVTGHRAIKDVHEDDYVALAKALMKDAAKYEFGLKK